MMTLQTNANREEVCGNYFYFYNLLFSESLLHLCLRALRSELLHKAGDVSLLPQASLYMISHFLQRGIIKPHVLHGIAEIIAIYQLLSTAICQLLSTDGEFVPEV